MRRVAPLFFVGLPFIRRKKVGFHLGCENPTNACMDKTMADKLMYIPNMDETQNYPFCRLQLVVERLGHST